MWEHYFLVIFNFPGKRGLTTGTKRQKTSGIINSKNIPADKPRITEDIKKIPREVFYFKTIPDNTWKNIVYWQKHNDDLDSKKELLVRMSWKNLERNIIIRDAE